jgi:DNA replicative helicase MCM subunit Mcm2 (Cdc46/Mcm family)
MSDNMGASGLLDVKDLRVELLHKEVTVRGVVNEISMVHPKMIQAAYTCLQCENIDLVDEIKRPKICSECQEKDTMILSEKYSIYANRREMILSQMPDQYGCILKKNSITVELEDSLVEGIKEEDAVIVTGLLKTSITQNSTSKNCNFVIAAEEITVNNVEGDFNADSTETFSSETKIKRRAVIQIIKDVGEKHPGKKAPIEEVYSVAESQNITKEFAEETISILRRCGDLIKPDKEHVKAV